MNPDKDEITNTAILPTQKPVSNAAAFDVLARYDGSVGIIRCLYFRGARIEAAVEGLVVVDPKLEAAGIVRCVAAEGDLGWFVWEHSDNTFVYSKCQFYSKRQERQQL